jgi:hypothetical protein
MPIYKPLLGQLVRTNSSYRLHTTYTTPQEPRDVSIQT